MDLTLRPQSEMKNIFILLVGKYNTKLVNSESHFFADSSSFSVILTWKKKRIHNRYTYEVKKSKPWKFDAGP